MSYYLVVTSWEGTLLILEEFKCLRIVWNLVVRWIWASVGLDSLGSIKGRKGTSFKRDWIEGLQMLSGEGVSRGGNSPPGPHTF